ncbi:hypothetical protein ACFLSV_02315 [Bacteroidota bacterium]
MIQHHTNKTQKTMVSKKFSRIVKTITILLIFISFEVSYCQDSPDSYGINDSISNLIPSISFETAFNGDDFMLGFIPGVHFQNLNLTAGALFFVRPYKKKVCVERSPNFYYKFQEWRIAFGLILEKRINLMETISLSLSIGGGYTIGGYAGTSRIAEKFFLPIFRIGLTKEFDNILIGLRYQYMEIPDVSHHQGNFSFIYLFKE